MAVPLKVTIYDCKKLGLTGVVGLEAASGYWGLSSYSFEDFPVFLYESTSGKVERITSNISYTGIPTKITLDHTAYFQDGIYITDMERTICDMIEYGADDFTMLESIDGYSWAVKDQTPLIQMAKERGLYDKLVELQAEADEMFS